MENSNFGQSEKWLPPLIFLVAFGFLLIGLNPSFYTDDSAETITACATLGIPHPPGYPLHTLLGSFFARLPLGPVSFRVDLFTGVLASLVCAGLFIFLRNILSVSLFLAAPLSLAWVVGAASYPGALGAKAGIYHLAALFLLAILAALFRGKLEWAVFLGGLSMANHWMSMAAFSPGLLYLGFACWKQKGENGRPVFLLPSLFLLGFSLYLFLPLRALLEPSLNWGDPSIFSEFLSDFFRAQYRVTEGAASWGTWFLQWGLCLKSAFMEFPPLFLLALWGVKRAYAHHPIWVKGIGFCWLGLIFFVRIYLNLSPELYFLINAYMLSAHTLVILLAGLGLQSLLGINESGDRKTPEWIWAGALGLLLVGLGVIRFTEDRQTHYTYSYDFVLNSLKGVPRNALYLCRGDDLVFPCWYFQWVEGKRPDVAVVGVDGFPMDWIRKDLASAHPGLKVPRTSARLGKEAVPSLVQWLVEQNAGRDLYFSYNKVEDGLLPDVQVVPCGLAARGFMKGQIPIFDEGKNNYLWDSMRLRNVGPGFPVDVRTRKLVLRDYGVFRNTLGIYEEDLGDQDRAKVGSRSKTQDFWKMQTEYQKSYESYLWAAQWDPSDAQFACNVGNALYHLGRTTESMDWYQKAVGLDPKYISAYFNGAVAALAVPDYQKAGQWFEKVLELQPDYAEAASGLAYAKSKGYNP